MIPTSMHVPDCTKDSVEVAYGGSASVLQSTYKGRCVAVKIFRVHNDLNTVLSVSTPPPLQLSYELILRRGFAEKQLLGSTSAIRTFCRYLG